MVDSKDLDEVVAELMAHRVSFIVGSGASNYKRFGVPILKQKLLDLLKSLSRTETQLRINANSHVGKEPSECSLEELLSIYDNIYQGLIDSFLELQGIKPKSEIDEVSPLGYEILSHFVSHRLIDHVISFNFDEYLEVALDDEIGEDGYEWVKSKSVFQKMAEDIEFRGGALPPKPLLIKPHGTISYSSTIRPTFETVQRFEKEKQDLLEKILNRFSTLVILGFSCPDADFQKVMKKLILTHQDMKIFWVDSKDEFPTQNEMFKFAKRVLKDNCKHVPSGVDKFLTELGDHLHEKYEERYPGTARHKFRTHLAEWGALKSTEDLFKLETVIYGIRARGMFSLEGLLMCKRIDNCCKKIVQSSIKIKNVITEIENAGFLKKNNDIKSAEVYYIPILDANTPISKKILDIFSVKDNDGSKQDILSNLIGELIRDFDFDFGRADNYLYLKFYDPTIIQDYKKLYEYDRRVIETTKEKINIIAETGEWIIQDRFKPLFEEIKKKGVKINLILADIQPKDDDSHRKLQEDKLKELLGFFQNSLEVKYLPWDKHNVHMTINEQGSGIYFYRKYKSPVFTPVYIAKENERDCRILRDEFDMYYKEAH